VQLKVIPISDVTAPFFMMARCSKCDIDKEASEYYTYYHSTQKKWRTRKICNSCMYQRKGIYRKRIKSTPTPTPIPTPLPVYPEYKKDGRRGPRLVDESVFIGMDSKICFTCQIEKPANEFYIHRKTLRLFTSCKQCDLLKEKKEYQQYIEDNAGSHKVRKKAGEWVDEYQQENVEGFLKLIGWKHNGKHWYKEGVRSGEDGVWERMRGMIRYRRPITTKKTPILDNLRLQVEDIVKLRQSGKTLKVIAGIYSTSIPTIYKVINEYYAKK
jgi:hypothetical protein